MSDNGEEDDEGPAVPLGEGEPVEGAPTARVASRLYFPIEESEVRRRESETVIRTPDGPRELGEVLRESDEVYFPDRQSFVGAVRSVVGTGPVPTAGGESTSPVEADNAAEAPQGADSPDEANAAEADEDADEGEFEFQNDE